MSIHISIPQPCTEDWDTMTPKEQGRFCDKCQKCVVDFTGFTDEQLYKFFAEHKGQNVCGRFMPLQLSKSIYVPKQNFKRIYRWVVSLGIVILLTDYFSPDAMAQGTCGKIVGTIYDIDRKNISNALVQISEGGLIRDTVYSNKDGGYVTKKLTPGRYTVFIQHPGFARKVTTDVLINPDKHSELNTILKPCDGPCNEVDTSIYIAPLTMVMGGVGVNHTLTYDEIEHVSTRNTGNKKNSFFARLWNKIF